MIETSFLMTDFIRLSQKLQSAHEVHQFDHDLDELKSRISEKEVVLDSQDWNNDLFSVQALIRQHEVLEVQKSPETNAVMCFLTYGNK